MTLFSAIAGARALERFGNALRRVRLAYRRLPIESEIGNLRVRDSRCPAVLVLGVYLCDRPSMVGHLVRRFARARRFAVTQAWVAINGESKDRRVNQATVARVDGLVPKFSIMNRLLAEQNWRNFDFLVVVDDDIVLPPNFVDCFLALQMEFDFALAQPARTWNSFYDWKFCTERSGVCARRTRFVEIGPLVSMRGDFAREILPFDERSGMGWGYDFVWPVVAERANLRLGIIDATPVDHSLRGQATTYARDAEIQVMRSYLATQPHLSREEAFTIVEAYSGPCRSG
jgi:hypothetical protein